MENIPDDELISAYLDGELTGQDLARAEQLLASQPDSRQMLDELTALRASLKSLPQQKLGPDFAESVLRRAEREMLQPGAASSVAVTDAAALPVPIDTWNPEVPPILSTSRWTRPLVWAALTTAAAIMIMMFSPPDAKHKVAMAPPVVAEPGPADQTMQARAVDAPSSGAATVAEAAPDGAAPTIAGNRGASPAIKAPGSPQSGFYAGPATAARGAIVNQTPEPLSSRLADDDDASLLVVRCDITPEVARSASFRRLLAEHQIPWQEAGSGANSSDPQATFAAQQSAGARANKQGNAVADNAKGSERTPEAKKEGFAAGAAKPAADRKKALVDSPVAADGVAADPAADSSAARSNTEAVYVIAMPSQVDATIAAIAGSGEYHNIQMKELRGSLPAELRTRVIENSDRTSNVDDVQDSATALDSAAQDSATTTDPAKGASSQDKRDHAEIADGADRGAAPSTKQPTRMAVTAPAPANSADALGAADAIASPAVAHAAPASLSSETIAELSRAMDDAVADEKSGALHRQSDEQTSDKRPAEEKSSGDQQNGDQKIDAQDQPRQQKFQLGRGEAATDPEPEGSLGASQRRSGKVIMGELKAGQKKLGAPSGNENAPAKAYSGGGQLPAKGMAAPSVPAPAPAAVLAPAAAPKTDSLAPRAERAVPASEPASGDKQAAGLTIKRPRLMAGKDSDGEGKESIAREAKQGHSGGALDQDRNPVQKHEADKSLEGVSARRAIFLFRVVPAPAAAQEP